MFAQAIASAASVGLGCGAGCGSSASAFLSTYVLSEGRGMGFALRQVLSFYLGKLAAVLLVCLGGALAGRALIQSDGTLLGVSLGKAVYAVMLCAAIRLIYDWFRERKGCAICRHCGGRLKAVPSFAVGLAYGLSPCAPLLMVLGYAAALTVPAALMLGTVFALASSLVPALLILALAGALSTKITAQLGRALPRFQLAVYGFYLFSAVYGLMK
ncbi:MAG: hypothetical protein IKQ80_06970 [Clostridia bacterium]|nr:hypothetical protein [Clostridia bacterium]